MTTPPSPPRHACLPPCHHCDTRALQPLPGYEKLHRVSSDCKPIPHGGCLAFCNACGTLQKPNDVSWQQTTQAIYSQYDLYHQAAGSEQLIFDQHTGRHATRSAILLQKIFQHTTPPPHRGRLLDVGCGNGATLRAASQLLPHCKLTGTELSDTHRNQILSIPNVEAFHAGDASAAQGPFDLITLIHVLEHIPSPATFLRTLIPLLAPRGRVVIQVPCHHTNPFDLLIADHSSHFTPTTLHHTLTRAGLAPKLVVNTLISKESTAIAEHTANESDPTSDMTTTPTPAQALQHAAAAVQWLDAFATQARALAARGRVAVFGTSIAGTWLGSFLGEAITCFLDEDPTRQARPFMAKPVLPLHQAPRDIPVILALPPAIAATVQARLVSHDINWWLPVSSI